jgi:amino acid transporter
VVPATTQLPDASSDGSPRVSGETAGDKGQTPSVTISEQEAEALRKSGRTWTSTPRADNADRMHGVDPDLDLVETRGKAGQRYVRVVRAQQAGFERVAPGLLLATKRASGGTGRAAQLRLRVRTAVLGTPMATHQFIHERLTKVKALAVLSSDALSSVAYATEQTLVILGAAGAVALSASLPIMAGIAALLLIVVASYRQTIKAYPKGGGSYIVAKDNLGDRVGLVAAAALMTDYVLTVAVSVASGKDFVGAAIPWVADHPVVTCVTMIVLILLGNLRGIRESASIFAAPTYIFVGSIFVMLAVAYYRIATHSVLPVHTASLPKIAQSLGIILVLRAFASGCTALTGVEAISDGVPAFKPPEWRNARTTLVTMGAISVTMFVGITVATHIIGLHPFPNANPPIVTQLAAASFGEGTAGLYVVTGATAAILILAANTAFSDFPRLLFFLARDKYAPHQFSHLGDRLAYSNGIIVLGTLASVIVVVFGGVVDRLIPLYTIGVFLAFTLSQSGMVARWLRRHEPGWRRGLTMNLVGAVCTGVVFIIVASVKFLEGAFVIVAVVPALVLLFHAIHKHYIEVAGTLATETPTTPEMVRPTCIVPISDLNAIALQSLALARSFSTAVIAVHVCDSEEHTAQLREKWEIWGAHVPLTIIESPYRVFLRPLLAYIDAIDRQHSDDTLVVVLPELVATRWWHAVLHNQTALRLKGALLFRPGTVVVSVPHHLRHVVRMSRRRHRDDDQDAL